ncbi:cyclic pyranopterin monophosphate synthase MoaC [Thiohalorhabdus sp.]|uniref:cyclic pyranopterin monophosphate synthase MoaC n=1 Tax=Thiohalorhabdus sp. TaxID=3094134 RepID=UPI002FC2BE94
MSSGDDPLSHFDEQGNARMVDVGGKAVSERLAVAEGWIRMETATLGRIRGGQVAKGDVLGVARVAAIQAAKQTGQLIPLCHPVPLTSVDVAFSDQDEPPAVRAEVTAKTANRTGVEMEALSATSVALLTIYDMCKAMDRAMSITEIRLVEKAGGRSGHWRRDEASDDSGP